MMFMVRLDHLAQNTDIPQSLTSELLSLYTQISNSTCFNVYIFVKLFGTQSYKCAVIFGNIIQDFSS